MATFRAFFIDVLGLSWNQSADLRTKSCFEETLTIFVQIIEHLQSKGLSIRPSKAF